MREWESKSKCNYGRDSMPTPANGNRVTTAQLYEMMIPILASAVVGSQPALVVIVKLIRSPALQDSPDAPRMTKVLSNEVALSMTAVSDCATPFLSTVTVR